MSALFSRNFFIFHFSFFILFSSCAFSQKISHHVDKILLKDSVISTGHIGISIYEPATDTYWYNYNATQNFIPASNTKLFTLYAGMKYLGDSLVGLRYTENDSILTIEGTGDPTLLHPDFPIQNAFNFIHNSDKKIQFTNHAWQFKPLGSGWAWDDYNEKYMPERSEIPAFGNVVKINFTQEKLNIFPNGDNIILFPLNDSLQGRFQLQRGKSDNLINIYPAKDSFTEAVIPLANVERAALSILKNAFKKEIGLSSLNYLPKKSASIKSQPVDSLFKPMMYNSDNFFAEQTLLMVSNEKLGYMNDEAIIDTLLKNDLKDIPQKPRWVDGSGLSRYNLFTPKSFVYILNKMKNEFGLERLKRILPTGGQGTLKDYYISDSTFIYAKTGSMSNQSTISGFLITKKNKLLIFSVLANSFQGRATLVRRSVECFLQQLRNKY